MCLAIFKPTGNDISIDNLKRGWEANDDGAGFCYIDNAGEIVIEKFMTWEEFEQAYVPAVEAYGDCSPFLIHFRITSKGTTSIDNCHPFRVSDDMAIIHNGTISNIDIDKLDKRSDTRIFAEEYLPNIGEAILDNIYLFEVTEGFLGYSKVCILHRTRGVFILNEEMGHWNDEDGCWYSNKSYEPKRVCTYVPPKDNITYLPSTKKYSDGYGCDYMTSSKDWMWNDSDDDFKETVDTQACEFCKTVTEKDMMNRVEYTDGAVADVCIECYYGFQERNDNWLCQDCLNSANTAEYYCPELGQAVNLCNACKTSWEVNDELRLIELK